MRYRPINLCEEEIYDDEDEDDEVIMDNYVDKQVEHFLWKQVTAKIRKLIRALRSLGVRVNVQDVHGTTPLHIATKSGNNIAVEALLVFPETISSPRDDKDLTPLDWAVVDERTHIADMLRDRGGVHSEAWRTRLGPLYAKWKDDCEEELENSTAMAIASTAPNFLDPLGDGRRFGRGLRECLLVFQ